MTKEVCFFGVCDVPTFHLILIADHNAILNLRHKKSVSMLTSQYTTGGLL